MKNNNIVKFLMAGILGLFMFSCSDWVTPENIKFQDFENGSDVDFPKTEEYYAKLREYRKSDHKILFGWFGYWNGGVGASTRGSLASAPDSMDIFSVFGKYYYNLTPLQIKDLRFAQEVKGQKVVFTFLMQNVGLGFENTKEGIVQYAHALLDSVAKYNFDGIDLDYEPNYGGSGYFSDKANVKLFVETLGEKLGPMSGTDKLLILDGEYDTRAIDPAIVPYFNYVITQAYSCTGYSNLDSRLRSATNIGWKKEQFIVTEEFQKYASTGGVNFRLPSGERVPSLVGMAHWAKERDAGGCGAFHIEFDYNNYPCYKYAYQALKVMNPDPEPETEPGTEEDAGKEE